MKVLDGSEVAQFIKERQAKQVRNLRQSWKVIPRLAVVQTVDSPVIDTYVRLKQRYAEDILVEFEHHKVDQQQADSTIRTLNERTDIHGIIVQLPLADTDTTEHILNTVSPHKDVDGLGAQPVFDPATPVAINWLLNAYGVELTRARVAIVGAGRLVGAPLAQMWRFSDYDVTTFDERSTDMAGRLSEYDVVVSATGVPGLITADMIKKGAAVVDAGTASENGVIVGDVASSVRARTDISITPLKGGVGPLTIAALLDNVIMAARRVAQQADES